MILSAAFKIFIIFEKILMEANDGAAKGDAKGTADTEATRTSENGTIRLACCYFSFV